MTLKQHYREKVALKLKEKFGYKNIHQVPQLKKIVISMGLANASKDKKLLEACFNELTMLSGQRPVYTKSTKSISNFKLREGQVIGAKVTLRKDRMYDFLYRFQHISAPRISDFRGFKPKGDGRGSLSIGLKDQSIFTEIDLNKIEVTQGMNITFVTSAQTNEECVSLLQELGLPLKKN